MDILTERKPAGIYPTPPLPHKLARVSLTENALQVLRRRYVRRNEDGTLAESVEEMFWRVAYHIAKVEEEWGVNVLERAKEFYQLLSSIEFLPNSPTFTGAGTPLGQLAACFVLPISDDMGRGATGIFTTLRDAALIQQTGGGNGFSFSRLRPQGSVVKSSSGQATGPVGFLRVYDQAFGEVAQGGTRRGANMAVLRVDHPDIEHFITCKTDEGAITNFNISVGIPDTFMRAVEKDDEWELRFPDVRHPSYRGFDGTLEQAEEAGIPIVTYKRVRARDLFDMIVRQAHHNGEPGVLFLDTANKDNPVPDLYTLEATNPCGEQWLGPYENCCLGSINLARHIAPDHSINWRKLEQTVILATTFLDDVVNANKYVPAVPQLIEAAYRNRRIGLGIMGLADLLYHVGLRYGSSEGQEFSAQVMEFIRYHSMLRSIELAKERGSFQAIEESIYSKNNMRWLPPVSIVPYDHDWKRPDIQWETVVEGIKKYGIRNAAQTTIAPTGTIATVAGCEGYGCEPVFALAYTRHVNDNGKDLELQYASTSFIEALKEANIPAEKNTEILSQIINNGSCQELEEIPEHIRSTFVVSQDIEADEHVRMQAALQAFVDNSLSKTINFPVDATYDEVANAYRLAWKLGCKGITVYVTGSREQVVLETNLTKGRKNEILTENGGAVDEDEMETVWMDTKKPRPRSLPGYTYSIETPLGKAFITINENGNQQPFEVFINTAKAGSDTAAVSEAIGRLISYVLRLSSPLSPISRLKEVFRQLAGIGGGRPMGFGPNRVRSLPDGVSQVLDEYLKQREEKEDNGKNSKDDHGNNGHAPVAKPLTELEPAGETQYNSNKIGDLCPDCGQAAVVNEEGCRKCYACGYSEC